jgi:Nucleotidyl transferase AbiEii toxin, Type IV TA system
MIDYLMELVRAAPTPAAGMNLAREYLQARILGVLQHAGAMIPLAFHGGTALRFLCAIPRYSEDLDFALERLEAAYDFRAYLRSIQREMTAEGYRVEIRAADHKTVHSAFIQFVGLPYESGLSAHAGQKLSVKIEVDTRPPAGAGLATTVVRRHVTLQLQHHDRPTLLAGKMHAVLQRRYVKGRDLFDLMWYLSDREWPEPNLLWLNNALNQTGWRGHALTPDNWREEMVRHVNALTWDRVVADVKPFLQSEGDVQLLTRENLLNVLHST